MIVITEKDDRLLLQFWEPKTSPEGFISVEGELHKEIDISAHIERAVRRELDRSEVGRLKALLRQTRNYVDRDHHGMLDEIDGVLGPR